MCFFHVTVVTPSAKWKIRRVTDAGTQRGSHEKRSRIFKSRRSPWSRKRLLAAWGRTLHCKLCSQFERGRNGTQEKKTEDRRPDRAAEKNVCLELNLSKSCKAFWDMLGPTQDPPKVALLNSPTFWIDPVPEWPLRNLCIYELLGSRVKWLQKHLKYNLALIRKQHLIATSHDLSQ